MKPKIAIIGAGITGITLAAHLGQGDVYEKSRGIGGRASVKRIEFEGQTFRFHLGIAPEHLPESLKGGSANAVLKELVRDHHVPVHLNHRLMEIRAQFKGYLLIFESGLEVESDWVIVTAPLPQAMLLAPFAKTRAKSVYREQRVDYGLTRDKDGFHKVLGASEARCVFRDHHTWRYARVENPYPESFEEVAPGFFFAGDAFGLDANDAKRAYLSGQALAQALKERLEKERS